MPAENMTIKAKWTVNQYTLTFDTNGGSAIAPITQDYGTAITAPADPSAARPNHSLITFAMTTAVMGCYGPGRPSPPPCPPKTWTDRHGSPWRRYSQWRSVMKQRLQTIRRIPFRPSRRWWNCRLYEHRMERLQG